MSFLDPSDQRRFVRTRGRSDSWRSGVEVDKGRSDGDHYRRDQVGGVGTVWVEGFSDENNTIEEEVCWRSRGVTNVLFRVQKKSVGPCWTRWKSFSIEEPERLVAPTVTEGRETKENPPETLRYSRKENIYRRETMIGRKVEEEIYTSPPRGFVNHNPGEGWVSSNGLNDITLWRLDWRIYRLSMT